APQFNGGYYVGQGADAVSVQRAYSQFLTQSVWSANSGQSRALQHAGFTQQTTNSVDSINSLAKSIADLNGQIQRASVGGAAPNDLLDARDQAISQLSQIVDVNVSQGSGGMVTISVGNGQP